MSSAFDARDDIFYGLFHASASFLELVPGFYRRITPMIGRFVDLGPGILSSLHNSVEALLSGRRIDDRAYDAYSKAEQESR